MGKRENQHLGLRPGAGNGGFEIRDEVGVGTQRNVTQVAPRDDHRVGMNRVGGVGTQHHVPGAHGHQHEMGEPFLGPDRRNRFGLGIQIDAMAPLVPLTNRRTQVRNYA